MSLRRRTAKGDRPSQGRDALRPPFAPLHLAQHVSSSRCPFPPSTPPLLIVRWSGVPPRSPCGNPSRSSPASLRSCPLLTPSLVSTPPAEHRAKRRLTALALALTLPWPGRGSFASALLLLPSPPALLPPPLLLPRLFPPESGPPAPSALACQTAEHRFLSLSLPAKK